MRQYFLQKKIGDKKIHKGGTGKILQGWGWRHKGGTVCKGGAGPP